VSCGIALKTLSVDDSGERPPRNPGPLAPWSPALSGILQPSARSPKRLLISLTCRH